VISECSDALVPQSGVVHSSGLLHSDIWYKVTDVLNERGGFTGGGGGVNSSRKGGYIGQCYLRITTNNRIVFKLFYSLKQSTLSPRPTRERLIFVAETIA
jgi:hypothetical protein